MRNRQAGFALLMALLLAALVLIALTIVAPVAFTQGRREKEEELVFRGEQYRRGITLYHRRFGRPSSSIKQLLWTNERAYLRRAYPDPMTKDGAWRLIRLGAGGQLVGSVNGPTGPGLDVEKKEGRGRAGARRWGSTGTDSNDSNTSSLPIVGVGSTSEAASIRVFQGHSAYDEWEFIVEPYASGGVAAPGTGIGPRGRVKQQQPQQPQGSMQPRP